MCSCSNGRRKTNPTRFYRWALVFHSIKPWSFKRILAFFFQLSVQLGRTACLLLLTPVELCSYPFFMGWPLGSSKFSFLPELEEGKGTHLNMQERNKKPPTIYFALVCCDALLFVKRVSPLRPMCHWLIYCQILLFVLSRQLGAKSGLSATVKLQIKPQSFGPSLFIIFYSFSQHYYWLIGAPVNQATLYTWCVMLNESFLGQQVYFFLMKKNTSSFPIFLSNASRIILKPQP